MKLLQNGVGGESEQADASGRTVVVGVKLDSHSRELLTWALVKVAQPGDLVIALHVLGNDEIVNQDGKSSLLSLVKAFDSVLAVYEGFCNLKQVDLKLKICRGASARKILVREAKSYCATNVIVGTARKHHKIRSSTSVAKYCAKKLSKDCWVLAVHNGKVIFQREGCPATIGDSQGNVEHRESSLLGTIHRSLGSPPKVLSNNIYASPSAREKGDLGFSQNYDQQLAKAIFDGTKIVDVQNCSLCGPESSVLENSTEQSAEISSGDGDNHDESLAIVQVQKVEVASNSITTLIRQLPEVRPGWPLLRHADQSGQQTCSHRSLVKQISVVQWAMRLPSRSPSYAATLDHKHISSGQSSNLDGENGAIVLVGTEPVMSLPSPESNSETLPEELEGFHEKYSSTCRLFNYQELLTATSNFLAENLIGKGGSSQVYRGCLPDGKELAVKILKPAEDVLKDFVLEIDTITSLHHKNIISLLGFCFENSKFLLVYDFLSRGSLEEILHGTRNRKDPHAFGWSERYKVAVGVAEALDYLHSDAQRVIHRDVKSSNILLSDDFEPQLSDFGLAKRASTSSHITCTDVAGTFGYLAPEYFMYGKVNDKIDVYAYGVVLLELLSGRKPISTDYPKGQESLVMWANPILIDGKVSQLLDPSLRDNYNPEEIERVVLAASLCIRRAPRARPPMSLVLKLLQGDAGVTKWARQQINNASEDSNTVDDEICPRSDIQSHLNLALLDVDDDSLSLSSIEQSISLEDYLQGRWSRSSSFD